MDEEIWKPIEQLNGRYSISSLGRLRNNKSGLIRKLCLTKFGYHRPVIKHEGGLVSQFVHRYVLSTFNPIPGWENLQVHHKDFNRTNNRLDNLEWVTAIENNHNKTIPCRGFDTIHNLDSYKLYRLLLYKYGDKELITKFLSIS